MRTTTIALITAVALSATTGAAGATSEVETFYKDKTIRLIVGAAAGGGIDLNARLLARHLHKHIPGRPTIVVQNVPGASGLQMANQVYNAGARDGTVIATSFNSLADAPLLQPKAARFDSTKFIWLGSMHRTNNIAYVWHSTPVQSLEQLTTQEVIFGAAAPGSSTFDLAVLSRDILGLKIKLVRGYQSTVAVNVALERGEVHAQILGLDSLKAQRPNWIRDKLITVLGHYSLENPADLRSYPRIFDLARTEADRQALRLILARQAYGRPYFLPPDVPASRTEALRRAFDATMKDPMFINEAKQIEVDLDPMTGEETQALVTQVILNTPKEVAERVKVILETQAK